MAIFLMSKYGFPIMHHHLGCGVIADPVTYVTGFGKTDPNRTFGISRITNLKYLIHSESLLLGCSHAILAV